MSMIRFSDRHIPEIAVALVDLTVRWRTSPPGYFSAAGKEELLYVRATPTPAFKFVKRLDCTLFVHVAKLLFDGLGWVAGARRRDCGSGLNLDVGCVWREQRNSLIADTPCT
jgi:hypothetical protein